MTARTHDLAAFTLLAAYMAFMPIPKMSLATAVFAYGCNMIGGLMPDIDEATSEFWQKIRAGTFIGRLIRPLLGHHRLISHSLVGIVIAGTLTHYLLKAVSHVILVDMSVAWWSLMIGYVSHLIMDSLTHDGVPWLFPVPIRFGFPPFAFLRMKTGGIMEKIIIFPLLLLINAYFFFFYSPIFIAFLKTLIR